MFNVKRSDQGVSDLVLVDRVRDGDDAAFGGLWARHSDAGLRAARQISHRHDPEDLVQEAFARVLSAIRGGKGPREAFRPYLYASIRAVSMNWTRDRAKEHTLEDLSSQVDVDAMFEDVLLEQTVTGQAFKSLRPEWRTILWYTAVEGMSAKEAGPLLGLSPNAAAALAYRAREGLRVAWLQAHVRSDDADPACVWTVDRIGAYQRGGLRRKDTATFEEHLSGCVKCTVLVRETSDLATSLKGILLPVILGSGIVSLDVAKGGALAGAIVGSKAAGAAASGGSAAGGSTAGGSGLGASVGGTVSGGAGLMGGAVASAATVTLVAVAAVAIGIGTTTGRTPSPNAEQSVPVADAEDWPRPDPRDATSMPDRRASAAEPAPTQLPASPSVPTPDGNPPHPDPAPAREPQDEVSAAPARPDAPVGTPAAPPALETPRPAPSAPAEPTPTGEPISSEPPPQTTSPEPEPTKPDRPRPGTKPGPDITIILPGTAVLTLDLSGKGRGHGHKHGHQYGHQGGRHNGQQAGGGSNHESKKSWNQ